MDNVGPHEAHRLATDLLGNADDVLVEAGLLLEHGHPARAYFLATIAAEEMGKIEPCLDLKRGEDVAASWKQGWTNHQAKLRAAYALESAFLRDDVVHGFEGWVGRDEVGPWARAKMAALYVDIDDDGHVRRPGDTRAGDASEAVQRGQAASALLHAALDPVTPEAIDALPAQIMAIGAVMEGLLDDEDPEGSIRLLRETLAAATSGDASQLQTVLNSDLVRLRAKNEPGTRPA